MERAIARLASRQHGVVKRANLRRAGITNAEIRHRIETGALIPEYRGVYRVGHRAPSVDARYLAAVYASGDRAVLSGRAAAYLFGLLNGHAPEPEVTVPSQRRVKGVRTRRMRLHRPEMATVRGIRVTSVPRTLIDLAAELSLDELALACHQAGVHYRTKPRHIARILELRDKSPPGIGKLRLVMIGDAQVLLSELERGFVKRLREARLPLPVTNKVAGCHYVDCRWPGHRLTVELQSYRFHNSRYSWEQDHKRRREARARGDAFRTYTWADVFDDPASMLDELHELIPSLPLS